MVSAFPGKPGFDGCFRQCSLQCSYPIPEAHLRPVPDFPKRRPLFPFAKLRRKRNQLLFSPPPEPSHLFLLKRAALTACGDAFGTAVKRPFQEFLLSLIHHLRGAFPHVYRDHDHQRTDSISTLRPMVRVVF